LIVAGIGSFLIFMSIPLGLYIYSQGGALYAFLAFFVCSSLGFSLRFLAFPIIYGNSRNKLFREAVKSSILFAVAVLFCAIIISLIKNI